MAKSFARHWLTLAAGAAAVWLGLVLVAVPALIRAAYQQRAGVFNRLIGGRTTHPLSFYLDAWSRLALWLTLLLVAIAAMAFFWHRRGRQIRERVAARFQRDEYILSITELCVIAAALGSSAGLLEAILRGTRQRFAANSLAEFFPVELWLAPIASGLVFLIAALVYGVVAHRFRNARRISVVSFIAAFVAAYGVARAVRVGLHPLAIVILAIGLASIAARRTRQRPAGALRTARRTLASVLLVSLLTAAGLAATKAFGARSAVRRLVAARPGAPSVLFIILDTVRASSLGLYGHDRPTSPNLDAFARRGVTFDMAVATAPWTLPSHASMFTGRYPGAHRANWKTRLDGEYPVLAEMLSDAGYETAAFVANFHYASTASGIGRGFAQYVDYPATFGAAAKSSWASHAVISRINDIRGDHRNVVRRTAADINRELLDFLANRDRTRPYFAFVNYFDAHAPYAAPEPFRGRYTRAGALYWHHAGGYRYTKKQLQDLRGSYDESISYLDHEIGRLIRRLDAGHLLDNTIVIITSDHGEQFGEKEPRIVDHINGVYFSLLHVPLIAVSPGLIPADMRVTPAVSLGDLPATVLELAGVPPAADLPGGTLSRFWHPSAVGKPSQPFAELTAQEKDASNFLGYRGQVRTIIRKEMQYIRDAGGREELYDLPDDPFERADLSKRPGLAPEISDLRSVIDSIVAALPRKAQRNKSRRGIE